MGKSRYTPLVVLAMMIAFGALATQMWTGAPDEIVYASGATTDVYPQVSRSSQTKRPTGTPSAAASALPSNDENENDSAGDASADADGSTDSVDTGAPDDGAASRVLHLVRAGAHGWYFVPPAGWSRVSETEYKRADGVGLTLRASIVKAMSMSPSSMAGKVDLSAYASRAYANGLQSRYKGFVSQEQSMCRLDVEATGSLHGVMATLAHEDGRRMQAWAFLENVKTTGECGSHTRVLELLVHVPAEVDFSQDELKKTIVTIRRKN